MNESIPIDRWVGVHVTEVEAITLAHRSGLTVYEESLVGGQFVGRAWNGAGFLSAWEDVRLNPTTHPTPQAFWLEIDGQLLASHWEWGGFERTDLDLGLHTTATLQHAVRPVTVKVHTLLDGTPILTRWLEITNTADRPAALAAVAPWSGVLQVVKRWAAHTPGPDSPLFSIGYMANDRWGDEGHFQWQPLPNANFRIDGRYRRDRHRHPMFVLRNHATGEHFVGQLAWTGGYSFEFDLNADLGTQDGAARLFFRAGPDAPAPQRIIAPSESVRTPEVHLGMLHGDLDSCIQAMHDHLRQSVFRPQARGRGGWVESGIGPEIEITEESVYQQIEAAAAVGAEVFFIDASWYAPPFSYWWDTVGDWQVDRQRFPDGLGPIRDRVHAKGMLFGLWMDAERLGSKSHLAQEHPEWLTAPYNSARSLSGQIDLTNPVVAQWMEEQIGQLISEQALEFFRLDYNVRDPGSAGVVERDGFVENSYWRYYEALYAIYDRLRARFPDVIFETCAGGGGRSDVGMVQRFAHTWVTDWQIAPRAFRITNGMTMALPPEYVDRLLGGQNGHTTADIDFQARLLLFTRPTIALFHPPQAPANPVQIARVKHMVEIYKDFVRPFHRQSRIYHHTPVLAGLEPRGWGVLELAARDRTRAVAGVFQLSSPEESEYRLRFRGLDNSRRYRLTWDNRGQVHEADGFSLAQPGLIVRLEGALTSELILAEAV